jgi:ubiquinone/menaquinone biosynthesis C-methylase UbiE
MSNAQLFSTVAREYANFRPGYPPALFAWLAEVAPSRDAVWDCGCGSGQASTALAEYFSMVYATDVAPEQVGAAKAHPRVRYAVAPAEKSGLADGSVDLVTVAQALHWFDVETFYAEARRVARRSSSTPKSSVAFSIFMKAWSDRTGRRSAGTSKPAIGRCRFPLRSWRNLISGWNCVGASSRSPAT